LLAICKNHNPENFALVATLDACYFTTYWRCDTNARIGFVSEEDVARKDAISFFYS